MPSLCITTEKASSAVAVPISVVFLPSVPKVKSSVPSELYLTTAKSVLNPKRAYPATTILPSLCITTERATSSDVGIPISVVTFPPVPKLVSNEPSELYLTTAKSLLPPMRAYPATTILPSLCITTERASSAVAVPISVVTFPPVPKLESKSPSAAQAGTCILNVQSKSTVKVTRNTLALFIFKRRIFWKKVYRKCLIFNEEKLRYSFS